MFRNLRFEKRTFDDFPIELNDEFMLEQALLQARIDIGLHVQKHYVDNPLLILTGEIELKEVDVAQLVHLQVRKAADFLRNIQSKTECESLKVLTKSILALPTISYERSVLGGERS